MRLTYAKDMKAADEFSIAERGTASLQLMENAATTLVTAVGEVCNSGSELLIFCGSGNNGGDGAAAARILQKLGYKCSVYLIGDAKKLSPDMAHMVKRLDEVALSLLTYDKAAVSVALNRTDAVIDALYGFGLNREICGQAAELINMINDSGTYVLSADIASGISADTGEVLGTAVRASHTVTFSSAKPGHFLEPGCVYTGKLTVSDIGIDEDILERSASSVCAVTASDIHMPTRTPLSHKSHYGKVLVVGGSVAYTGAVNLTSVATVRSGAGLVYVGVPNDIFQICCIKNNEAMPFPLASDVDGRLSRTALQTILRKAEFCDVLVLGPGLGRSEELCELVSELVRCVRCQIILDADALYAISATPQVLKEAHMPVIITPHEGEFSRLYPERSGERLKDTLTFSAIYDCLTVLKGHRTVSATPKGEAYINTTGNAGMAKGGSGDVLCGLIGALCCVMPAVDAVRTAVWLHGRAGDLACTELGEHFMTATDIINNIGKAMAEIKGR